MNVLASVIGILTVAAVTPGPNNFIVMNAGARRGVAGAAGAIAGVIAGSVVLYAVVAQLWNELSERLPLLFGAATLLSAAYLTWLGVLLFRAPKGTLGADTVLPASPAAIAAFQFVNPKAWALMAAVVAGSHARIHWLLLVPVMVVVLASCLALWAAGGIALSRCFESERGSRWLNGIMGTCLIVFACTLAWDFVAG